MVWYEEPIGGYELQEIRRRMGVPTNTDGTLKYPPIIKPFIAPTQTKMERLVRDATAWKDRKLRRGWRGGRR